MHNLNHGNDFVISTIANKMTLVDALRKRHIHFESKVKLTAKQITKPNASTSWECWHGFSFNIGSKEFQIMFKFRDMSNLRRQLIDESKNKSKVSDSMQVHCKTIHQTFAMNLCDHSVIDRPSGPFMNFFMDTIMHNQGKAGANYNHLSNNVNHVRHKYKHETIHQELEVLNEYWRPYVCGIHVVLMNAHNDIHIAAILMSKASCLKEMFNGASVHIVFHRIFDFDFVKRKHYQVCVVCNKKNNKSEGYMKCCALCKQRRYCSRKCQKIDWNKRGHRDQCFHA
eukprot:599603_1